MIKAALLNARMADFSFHSCMKFVLKCKNVSPKWFFFFLTPEVFKGTRFFVFFIHILAAEFQALQTKRLTLLLLNFKITIFNTFSHRAVSTQFSHSTFYL